MTVHALISERTIPNYVVPPKTWVDRSFRCMTILVLPERAKSNLGRRKCVGVRLEYFEGGSKEGLMSEDAQGGGNLDGWTGEHLHAALSYLSCPLAEARRRRWRHT
jgi:hypothetical protein